MGRYRFAQSSIEYLKEVHPKLSDVMYKAKDIAVIDFDISCGYRTIEEQYRLFNLGRSTLDGRTNMSMHNFKPALAVDIYAYRGKYTDYSRKNMEYLSTVIKKAADVLGIKIVWGGDWTIADDGIVDMPHYELG